MEQKKKKDSVLKSFIEYFYGNFVVLLLGFISLPLNTYLFSTDQYGRTAMFTTAVSIIYIFAILGLDQSYIRFFHKKGICKKRLFMQCLCYPVIIILILGALYFCFADIFNHFLFGESSLDVTLLVISYTVISVFERFLFLNIRMEQNGKLYSNLNILSKVLYLILIVLFARILGDDFRVFMYAMTLPLFIVTVICGIRFMIRNAQVKTGQHDVTKKQLLSYGIPFVPMLLMEWLLASMDKWSITYFQGFAATGIYAAAMQIMTILLTFKITYVAFWAPLAMEKYEKESDEICKAFFADMFLKVQFLCMSAAFLLTIFRGIIVLIFEKDYREAIQIIPFLSLMPILSILFEMTGQGVKFVGKIKYFNYASLAAIICNLVGNTLLVPRLGGIGAAIATAATYVVYFAIGTYYSKKCYPVSYRMTEFICSLLLFCAYAAFATCTSNQILSAAVGMVIFLVHCLINRKILKTLWVLAWSMVKGLKK